MQPKQSNMLNFENNMKFEEMKKKEKIEHIFQRDQKDNKDSPKSKKLMLPPPILPKPIKKKEKEETSCIKIERALTTQNEIN